MIKNQAEYITSMRAPGLEDVEGCFICDDEPDSAVELDTQLAVGGAAQLDFDEGNLGRLPDFGRMIFLKMHDIFNSFHKFI